MSKLYAPLGYEINYKGKDHYDTTSRQDLAAAVLGLADWPEADMRFFVSLETEELLKILLDNGFEIEEK